MPRPSEDDKNMESRIFTSASALFTIITILEKNSHIDKKLIRDARANGAELAVEYLKKHNGMGEGELADLNSYVQAGMVRMCEIMYVDLYGRLPWKTEAKA